MDTPQRKNSTDKESIPFRFKVSGNIIRKLGEESISNKNIAVLELVKNSYDAGAKKVEILFKHEDTSDAAEIIISDDGDGMNLSDIENKWMNIATPNKSKTNFNKKHNRPMIGEKGLGRLSSESLGNQTTLITKPIKETTGYSIIFDWKKYQKDNIYVNEVINEGSPFEKKPKDHGTIIEITELKHDWGNIQTQKDLLKDIYLLNPPNKVLKEFKVIPKYRQEADIKKLRRSFLNLAAYYLKVRLTRGNVLQYDFLTLHGKKKHGIIELDNKLKCGDAVFELFMYYQSRKSLKTFFGKELSAPEFKEISDTLDEYHGIKLYRDNFRIKPYGDRGTDWIGLDLEAQNYSMCPRNNQVFGMVHLCKEKNPKITDTTTREGVTFNEEFRDLISFIRTSILKIFIDLRSNEESTKKKARKSITTPSVPTVKLPNQKISVTISPPTSRTEKLIDVKGDYPQNFYLPLEQEINGCYNSGFFNASFFLSRKFIESLIYDILYKKFPNEKGLWWNEDNNQSKALSPLINSLSENRRRFESNITTIIQKATELLGDFRNFVNPHTHNIYDYLRSKDELDHFRINDIIQLLVRIYEGIK